jgi:hypothetical protein
LLDQPTEPRENPSGVQRTVFDLRRSVTGQVGRHDPLAPDEARNNLQPVGRVPARTVQQDHWRAVTSLEHRGRDAGKRQSSLRDGQLHNQPSARLHVEHRCAALLLQMLLTLHR